MFDAYRKLFQLRLRELALTSGEVVWLGNSEPSSVVSFLRRKGKDEVVVIVNLSNRKLSGTVELPVADYCPLHDIYRGERIGYRMYPGKVQFNLGAYGFHIAKREPAMGMGDFDYRKPVP